MGVARMLDRLDGVRETGPARWLARCPAHDDKTPSLSVRELDDGRILLHDFGGCHVNDVLAAIGLEMSDLFPDGPISHRVGPSHRRIPAADALAAIDHEAHVVAFIAADVAEHKAIDDATWRRLAQAVARIGSARAMSCPARPAKVSEAA